VLPRPDAPALVCISPGRLLLDRRPVSAQHNVLQSSPPDWTLLGLMQGLERSKQRFTSRFPGRSFPGEVHVCAHRRAMFKALKRILYTCRQTGHDRVSVGVLRHGATDWSAGCSRVTLQLPYAVRAARAQWPPEIRIKIAVHVGAGYRVAAGAEHLKIDRRDGRYDRGGLERALRQIRVMLPSKDDLALAVEDDVLLGDLMDTLETIHATGFTALSLMDVEGVLANPLPEAT